MTAPIVVPLASIEQELLKSDGVLIAEDDQYIVVTVRVEKRLLSEITMRTRFFGPNFGPKN